MPTGWPSGRRCTTCPVIKPDWIYTEIERSVSANQCLPKYILVFRRDAREDEHELRSKVEKSDCVVVTNLEITN